jgi:hypothetical protein
LWYINNAVLLNGHLRVAAVIPMDEKQTIVWLLEGDIAIQYQVYRDLLEIDRIDIQGKIAE